MHRLLGRLRGQAGSVQTLALGAAALLLISGALATSTFATSQSGSQAAAQQVALTAQEGARILAGEHGGSYAHVGLLSLHKVAGVAITPSSSHAWLSGAQGNARGYSLTATDPSGHTYTISARLTSS